MKTLIIFLMLTFCISHLTAQIILEEDEDYPSHPDSMFTDDIDVQYYPGGEALILKNQDYEIELETASPFEFGRAFELSVPKVFDTSIKPDKTNLPPLAKTADTSLCNQIIWSEPVLLFDNGASWLNLAVVGDTIHGVTGINPQSLDLRYQYYCRSTDGGLTFDIRKNIREDSVRTTGGTAWARIVAHRNKVFLFCGIGDTIPGGDLRPYSGYMRSTNGGETFTVPKKLVEYESYPSDITNSGDTIVIVLSGRHIYVSTNFGETWKYRGRVGGGRNVFDPRIALAGGWLHQTNSYFPPGRWTRYEVAYYRSRVMRKTWSRRQMLSTNDGISSIQGDVVAEPNGFVGVIWGDGKYGSNFGHDGTPIFRRSLDFGKTFEPEVRLTDSPEASWGVMRPKPIAVKRPVISAVWCATFENGASANALKLSFDSGSMWSPTYYCNISGLSPNTAIGNGRVYWAMYDVYVGSYFVYGILPPNIKTETAQINNDGDEESNRAIKISNYPNPFNSVTTISYNLTQSGNVTLKVYDVLGREAAVLIDNEYTEEGYYEKEFLAERLTSGIYYYRISLTNENGIKTESGKMLLVK